MPVGVDEDVERLASQSDLRIDRLAQILERGVDLDRLHVDGWRSDVAFERDLEISPKLVHGLVGGWKGTDVGNDDGSIGLDRDPFAAQRIVRDRVDIDFVPHHQPVLMVGLSAVDDEGKGQEIVDANTILQHGGEADRSDIFTVLQRLEVDPGRIRPCLLADGAGAVDASNTWSRESRVHAGRLRRRTDDQGRWDRIGARHTVVLAEYRRGSQERRRDAEGRGLGPRRCDSLVKLHE